MNNISKNVCAAVIAALVALSAGAVILLKANNNERVVAVIEKNGTVIKKIDLSSVTAPYTLKIDDSPYPVTLKIERGKISFINANCPDKLCQKTGAISRVHQSAICLPARVCIHIEGDNNEFDSITG